MFERFIMTFFERFESLRKEKGISQGKLEKELGFSNGSISKWKNSTPTAERLQKAADYFGVTVQYLMTGEEKEIEEEKRAPGLYIGREDGTYTRYDFSSLVYSIMEAVEKMPEEKQEIVNDMVRGKRRKKNFIVVHNPETRRTQTNAAHLRTDIEIPENIDTTDNNIMMDEDF